MSSRTSMMMMNATASSSFKQQPQQLQQPPFSGCRKRGRIKASTLSSTSLGMLKGWTLLLLLLTPPSSWGFRPALARRDPPHLSASTTVPPLSSPPRFFRESTAERVSHAPIPRIGGSSVIPPACSNSTLSHSSSINKSATKNKPDKPSLSSNTITAETTTTATSLPQLNTTTLVHRSARQAWERKYCSVAGLREAFGRNHNVFWGDLDAATTRRLYKCLLPVALLELPGHVPAQELAPLAYRARVAAKLYARERSQVPARMFAAAFDGYRQWRKYGSFDCTGMTYDQVWNKYAALIGKEEEEEEKAPDDSVTAKICLKILERSCQSNEMIDRLVLKNKDRRQRQRDLQELRDISEQLERDISLLLQQPDEDGPLHKRWWEEDHDAASARQRQKFRALRAVAKVKRRIAALQKGAWQQQR